MRPHCRNQNARLTLVLTAPCCVALGAGRTLQGKNPQQVYKEIQDTWFPALSAGWKLWPFVHCVTFSPLIQPDLKLLFVGARGAGCGPSRRDESAI